ncbi:CaiB/BaiF CoA transferase family protein [Plastoroseomonas hellenica]|uniref:CaiB/BaiF CoA transferase family protein n=1 Tax=Plastoroseomonas hellenica TaxID=2687306 RepID=UPI001BA454CB|nr:CoA transferase [Plastoroseomonas hellenica]MBR0641384.1 CoA transferase [Plastoroseomonas hellenica]
MRPDFLSGIRFTDLTWAGAGPFGTKVFSDFGAEVLKIESMSRPDPVRRGGPFKDGIAGTNRSGYFASRNTGKHSVALDLKSPEGRAIALRLIAQSDVVSNNFGPGAMERLGLTYDEVRAVKPDIIYLSMPMYGEDGPLSTLLGVGMTIAAVTGMMWMTGYGGQEKPLGPGTHYPDHAANPYHAAFAVLAALRHRRHTGRGMKIDLSQVESTANFVGTSILEASMRDAEPEHPGNRSRRDAPHNIFRCAGEDAWCAVAVESDAEWLALAAAIGRQDLAGRLDLRSAGGRLAAMAELEAAVGAWTAGRGAVEAASALQTAGVAAARVASARDLVEEDQQLAARDYWQQLDHPEVGPSLFTSPPFRIDGERLELSRPPLFGEHTEAVLTSLLGMRREEIADLAERKILA